MSGDNQERRADDPRIERIEEIVEHMDGKVNTILTILHGEGQSDGIKGRVSQNERDVRNIKWHLRAIWLAVVSGLIGMILQALGRGGPPT